VSTLIVWIQNFSLPAPTTRRVRFFDEINYLFIFSKLSSIGEICSLVIGRTLKGKKIPELLTT